MSYQVTHYPTPRMALDACLAFWLRHEIENNLSIGLLSQLQQHDVPVPGISCFSLSDADGICATAFTSRNRWIVSYDSLLPDLMEAIAQVILASHVPYDGILGKKEGTEELIRFVAPGEKPYREMMAHELVSVTELPLSPGRMVVANSSHLELCAEWGFRFQSELKMTPARAPEQWLKYAQEKIGSRNQFCWLDEQGEVVSVCTAVRDIPTASIIGAVYTPPELRGHGYARSCVHQATAELLLRGKRLCGLFTDLANPVSNRIYHQIGYRPIAAFSDYVFTHPKD